MPCSQGDSPSAARPPQGKKGSLGTFTNAQGLKLRCYFWPAGDAKGVVIVVRARRLPPAAPRAGPPREQPGRPAASLSDPSLPALPPLPSPARARSTTATGRTCSSRCSGRRRGRRSGCTMGRGWRGSTRPGSPSPGSTCSPTGGPRRGRERRRLQRPDPRSTTPRSAAEARRRPPLTPPPGARRARAACTSSASGLTTSATTSRPSPAS